MEAQDALSTQCLGYLINGHMEETKREKERERRGERRERGGERLRRVKE